MNKKKIKLSGFTLVELIVVITILAILGTIAIMAFGGYSKNARDSRRVSDLNNITKTLELFKLKAGFYPDPSNPFNVTYSGAIVWIQGAFGDPTTQNVEKLDKKPIDPLTTSEYTYSVTGTKAEFEIAAIYEGDNLTASNGINSKTGLTQKFGRPVLNGLVEQTYAAETLKSIVKGTYNGKIVKTNSGSTTYILGAPSIITSEITSVDMQTILNNKSFVFNNYNNLPSSYQGTAYSMTGGFDFSGGTGVVLFSGDITTLGTSTGKLDFANKLDTYYSVAPLDSNINYKEIIDIDTENNANGAITLINNYLENKVAGIVAEQSDLLKEVNISTTLQNGNNGYIGTTDTYIDNYNKTSNYGNATSLLTNGYGDNKPLLKFNLSSIPSNATVTSATLEFYISGNNDNGGGNTIYLSRILNKNWVESEATWNVYSSGNNWTSAGLDLGTDYSSSPDASSIVGYLPSNIWASFPITTIVQEWVSMPSNNHGVVITRANGPRVYINSSEFSDSTLRPKLTIQYTATTQ